MEKSIKTLVRKIINETVDSSTVSSIFQNHPGDIPATEFFPMIIPKQYKAKWTAGGDWWQNSCAAKMSIAMIGAGFPTGGGYQTEKQYNNVRPWSNFQPNSQSFKKIFRKYFGEPTLTWESTSGEYPLGTIPPQIKGKKGVFVFSTTVWADAGGHVDAFDGTKSAGGHEYWDRPGTWEFWSELGVNTKECGWGDDYEGYKLSNWECYDDPTKSSPAKNARKNGWGDDVAGYRKSGYKRKI
jgi:hypothetical protein